MSNSMKATRGISIVDYPEDWGKESCAGALVDECSVEEWALVQPNGITVRGFASQHEAIAACTVPGSKLVRILLDVSQRGVL